MRANQKLPFTGYTSFITSRIVEWTLQYNAVPLYQVYNVEVNIPLASMIFYKHISQSTQLEDGQTFKSITRFTTHHLAYFEKPIQTYRNMCKLFLCYSCHNVCRSMVPKTK